MNTSLFCVLMLFLSIGAFSLDLQAQHSLGENDFRLVEVPAASDTLRVSEIRVYDDVDIAFNPFKVYNINDEFIIVQDRIPESFFSTISWETLDVLYKWGRESRGPEAGEFPNYPYDNVAVTDAGEPHFQTYDAITGALRTLEITEEEAVIVDRSEIRMNPWLGPHNTMTRLSNEHYAFIYELDESKPVAQQADREWMVLRPDHPDSLFSFGSYPLNDIGQIEMSKGAFFHKTGIANQSGDRLAAFYVFFDALKIFDKQGTELYAGYIDTDDAGSPEDFFEDRQEYMAGSLPPRWADDDYIFTQRNIIEDEELQQVWLEVWNWQAELLYRAPLDHAITTFTVSREHGKIVGVYPARENALYVWELDKILEEIE